MQIRYLVSVLCITFIFSCHPAAPKRNMAAIIDSIRQANDDKENLFSTAAKIAFVDSMLQHVANNQHITEMRFYKAVVLLQAGDEQQAFTILDQLLGHTGVNNAAERKQLLKGFGITALRLGERQNCVLGHSAESCLMPLQGMGIHRNPFGSSSAIKAYTALLKIDSADLESRWLLNIAYMTLGQYPSKVPVQWLIPDLDKDSSNLSIQPFTDIAPQLRLDTKNRAGGIIVDDFNNDGFMDVVSSDWDLSAPMHYFKNNGNGSFTDISISSGLAAVKGGLNIVQADYNNDGFTDILVLRGAWMPGKYGKQPNSLLRNNGDNTFTDVTLESGLFSLHPTQTAVWRDFNNDGWLDLFIGNETTEANDPSPCELFINDQHGGFKDMAVEAGCNVLGFVKGVAAADYNNDGLMDIYISTCDDKKILLKNKGIQNGLPHFEDAAPAAGLDKEKMKTFATWFWDYDNDGWPDIFVCGYQPGRSIAYASAADALKKPDTTASQMYLYHNNHNGTFTNVSAAAGLNHSIFAMGSNFGDIDNDGYLDMYLGTGNPEYTSVTPNKLYKNIDGKKFVDITLAARVGTLQKGHGVAFSDIDNDGDQDIFTVTGGAYNGDAYYNSLYLNPGQNNNRWIDIDCKGRQANRSAIGSRIKLSFREKAVARTVYRDVNSGGSFGSSPLRREIGIGQADIIDEISITWAGSNKTQVFKNIQPNQCIRITEGQDAVEKVPLIRLNAATNPNSVFPCAPVSGKVAQK